MTPAIGGMVRTAREALGISTAELAKVSGMRRTSIESIEKGRGTSLDENRTLAASIAWIVKNGVKA
jgi:DNA-binding XRE family transcriptional regulator